MAYKLSVLAVPFGGHVAGKDLDGEFFDARSETGLEEIGKLGVYWHHARDRIVRRIGTADNWRKAKDGWWCDVTVTDAKLAEPLRRMAESGSLFASSGAVSHLTQRGPNGHIKRWLVGELSLTGNPSNRLAVARLAPAARPELAHIADQMSESIYGIQRLNRDRSPSIDRLQEAVWHLQETLAP